MNLTRPIRHGLAALAFASFLLALPAVAQGYTVTVHVHGAGTVQDVTNRNGDAPRGLMNCSAGPFGTSNASVTDCVGGTTTGNYAWGDIVRLSPSVSMAAASRGWVFDHWTDGTAGHQINCDPQSSTGDFSNPVYCEFQIFDNLYVDLWFRDVTGPQDTSLSGGPAQGSTTNSTAATFTFNAASDPDSTFECRLDRPGQAGSYYACGSPSDKAESLTGLTTNGQYAFYVRAKDPSGNYDASPASRTWTVDTVPPAPSITGGPAHGSTVNSSSADFTVGTNEGTVQCTRDGVAVTPCAGAQHFSGLADGTHNLVVTATDSATNSATITRTWTVDTTGPSTTITGPSGAIANPSPSFTLSANESPATFECSLDGVTFASCSSPKAFSNLADGSYTLSVRATDSVHNTGPVSTRTWTVDTVVPDTTILGGPAEGSTTPNNSVTFTFGSPESGTGYQCSVDGAAFATCSSPDALTLANGDHTFAVRARDAAGNLDASPAQRSFRVNSLDGDADGYNRPTDCNDADPSIHPGAADTPGDGIDQDCTGADAVLPSGPGTPSSPGGPGTPAPQGGPGTPVKNAVSATLGANWKVKGGRTAASRLMLTKLTPGATITIACRGNGCPKRRSFKAPAGGRIDLLAALRGRWLGNGTVVTITVSAPGMASKVITLRTRKAKPPRPSVVVAA